ncbi:hypothetical protein, partial [Xanthomonas vasicola]|uniref:hypothetical protein n=1 Tax=Xanthomonas vasicola TaxID=56459 RepID=UPI001C972B0D
GIAEHAFRRLAHRRTRGGNDIGFLNLFAHLAFSESRDWGFGIRDSSKRIPVPECFLPGG